MITTLQWTKIAPTLDQAFNGDCHCRCGLVGKDFGDLSWGATIKHPSMNKAVFKAFDNMDEAKAWVLTESNAINQRQ